jgi:hypothetical protein
VHNSVGKNITFYIGKRHQYSLEFLMIFKYQSIINQIKYSPYYIVLPFAHHLISMFLFQQNRNIIPLTNLFG